MCVSAGASAKRKEQQQKTTKKHDNNQPNHRPRVQVKHNRDPYASHENKFGKVLVGRLEFRQVPDPYVIFTGTFGTKYSRGLPEWDMNEVAPIHVL